MAKLLHACAFVLVVSAFACASAAAVTNTTNTSYRGYKFVSNVAGYLNMTLDYCDIKAAVTTGNYARALQIYEAGKNSQGSSGPRKFMTWSVAAHPGEPTYDMLMAYHKNATWLDTAIRTAAAQKKPSLFLGLISSAIHFKYFLHEIDAAYNKTGSNLNDPAEGAPHNLDEAWSLYAGAHPDQCDSLMMLADKLAGDMGIKGSPVNAAVTKIMNDLQKYALAGRSSLTRFATARQALRVQVATLLSQGFLREAYAAYVGGVCKSAATVSSSRDLAVAYWYSLAPQLVSFGAKPAAVAKVATALAANNYKQVASALKAVLGPVQVKALGTPVFAKINKIKGCKL